MLSKIITKIFGSKHKRDIRQIQPLVGQINEYFQQFASLTDEQLKAKTKAFKQRIADATAEVKAELDELNKILHADTWTEKSNGETDTETDVETEEDIKES